MGHSLSGPEPLIRSLREPAVIVDLELCVLERNEAAENHPLLSTSRPFSGMPAASCDKLAGALKKGLSQIIPLIDTGCAVSCACLAVPLERGALVIAPSDGALDHATGLADEQLAALVETAVDGVLCIDDHGHIGIFNSACEKIFGYAAAEVLGQNVNMLMPRKYAIEHDNFLAAYRGTGVSRDVEGKRKNGAVFPMKVSIGEFQHQDKSHFVGIVHDLSERAATEKRFRDLQNEVAHMGRVSAVAEMGSALAHELNQPLTALTLYLTAAERSFTQDPDKTVELFGRAKAEAMRAGEIIRRIRQMAERTGHEMGRFFLADSLKDSIGLCRLADTAQNCEFNISGVEPDFELSGDQTQIQQILINLIKNAMDATEGQEERRINIFARINDHLELFVEDNGPGISPGIKEQLFTPFASSKPQGLGVGLSISRNIANSHGGALELIDDAPPERELEGACFRLTLPLEANDDV